MTTGTIVDIVLLVILVLGFAYGWRKGFIMMVGKLVGLVIGAIAAAYITTWIFGWFNITWTTQPIFAATLFLAALLIVMYLVGLVFSLLNQVWRIASFIPLLGPLNRLLGAVLGTAENFALLVAAAFVVLRINQPSLDFLLTSKGFILLANIAERVDLWLPALPTL